MIKNGIGRVLYRMSRKIAGKGEVRFTMADLHKRCGSSQEPRFFAGCQEARRAVSVVSDAGLRLFIEPDRQMPILVVRHRPVAGAPKLPQTTINLTPEQSSPPLA